MQNQAGDLLFCVMVAYNIHLHVRGMMYATVTQNTTSNLGVRVSHCFNFYFLLDSNAMSILIIIYCKYLIYVLISLHCRNFFSHINITSKGRCGILYTCTCKEIVQDKKLDCKASSSLHSFMCLFVYNFWFLISLFLEHILNNF